MKIDCTRAYDGQGALRNGLYDAVRLPLEPNLYRPDGPRSWLRRALWSLGRWLGGFRAVRLLVAALVLTVGCTAQQRAETARASAVFACEVAVLAPHVPEALDAAELARDVVTGRVELPLALARLGLTLDQTKAVAEDFNTCFRGAPALEPLPAELTESTTTLRAPPAAPGNRWL